MKNFMKRIDMKVVPPIYEILAWKVFDISVDEKWAGWAVEMMQAGFETESLPMLDKPYNQFELKELTEYSYFYLFSFAKEDLEFDEFQYHCNDADRTNIDDEILKVFKK